MARTHGKPIPISPFGKAVLCLALFAAWRLCSTLFVAAPPDPGGDPAEETEVGSDASCLPLAREAGVRAAAGTGSNFVFSPMSIHAALAMVAAGALAMVNAGALAMVNTFVADATNQRIRDILPPGSVHSSTAVVLANALYFKGVWSHPFDLFTAPFHTPGGTTVRVPSMRTGRSQYIALYPGFRALKLPYKNDVVRQADAFYMLILLPDNAPLSLADLYDKAVSTPEFIRKHTPVEAVPVGRFMVPKFKFTFKFEASSDMRKLGVTRAFEGGDFSRMVSGGDGRLSITRVYHKATIEVDKQGTVAAAATAILMDGSALEESEPPHPVDFVADRPFLFAVVEERTGVLLFLGHVVNSLAG